MPNKSLGPCSIPVKILKNRANYLKQPLKILINLSFQEGFFLEEIKTARVAPIFFKSIITNFLPITILYLCFQFLVSYMKNTCTHDCIHFYVSMKYFLKTI